MHGSLRSAFTLLCLAGCQGERETVPSPPAPPLEPGSPVVAEAPPWRVDPPAEPSPAGPAAACLLPAEGAPLGAPWVAGPRGWVGVTGGRGPFEPGLRRARARALRCYQSALEASPGLRGAVAYTVVLGPGSEAALVDVRPESDLPAALLGCIEAALRGARLGGGPRIEGRLELRPERPARGHRGG